jgi:heptosyltransferase I
MAAPPLFRRPPASLCILRLSAIGDCCHTLAVVRSIQAHWPETRITWIIGKLEATLLSDIPGIEFVIFDKKSGAAAYRALWSRLRGRRFDALLHMQAALRASLASLSIGSGVRLGFDRGRAIDFQWLFTNRRIAARRNEHVLDGLFGFADALGVPRGTLRWEIPVPDEAREFAERHLPGARRTLILSPCSSARLRNWRNWAASRYAEVADHARERHGLRVVLTGGPTDLEREYGREIARLMGQEPLDLIGRTDLKQLLALLHRSTALICPDSGPAHMATAVSLPVIGLYATSNPKRTGPYLSQGWVVDKYAEAVRAEMGKRVEDVPWGARVRRPDAMNRISVEDVKRKLDALLGAAAD